MELLKEGRGVLMPQPIDERATHEVTGMSALLTVASRARYVEPSG
ncbi:hypothetical protein ACFZDI_12210 [Streptomyces sp. NPDC007907]